MRKRERACTLICGRAFFKPFGWVAYNFQRWPRAEAVALRSRVFLPSVYFLNGRNNKPVALRRGEAGDKRV